MPSNQAFTSFPGVGNLPQVFRWRHPATGDEVVVMNEQGYGRMIVLDEGTGFDTAMRWQYTGDNQVPYLCPAFPVFWGSKHHAVCMWDGCVDLIKLYTATINRYHTYGLLSLSFGDPIVNTMQYVCGMVA